MFHQKEKVYLNTGSWETMGRLTIHEVRDSLYISNPLVLGICEMKKNNEKILRFSSL